MSDETVPEYVPVPEDIPQDPPVPVPEIVSILDIENERDLWVQRETNMKRLLQNTFLNVPVNALKPALLNWAMTGYPALFPILSVQIDMPPVCSDGITRDVQAYLEFCFGCPLSAVVDELSPKLVGMLVSYVYTRTTLSMCVTRA